MFVLLLRSFFPLHLIHTYRELSLLGEEGNKEVSDLSWSLCVVCVSIVCVFILQNESVPNFTQNFLQIDRSGYALKAFSPSSSLRSLLDFPPLSFPSPFLSLLLSPSLLFPLSFPSPPFLSLPT